MTLMNLFCCEEKVFYEYMDDWETFGETTLPEK